MKRFLVDTACAAIMALFIVVLVGTPAVVALGMAEIIGWAR